MLDEESQKIVNEVLDIFGGRVESVIEMEKPVVEAKSQMVKTDSALVSGEKWEGSVQRALQSFEARKEIIRTVLVKGTDYGKVPGVPSDKDVLFKSGAEKIIDALNCYVDFEQASCVEDFNAPLFYFKYKAIIRSRHTNEKISTGLGSCNSKEYKYAFRKGRSLCPNGHEGIIKSKYNEGKFYCFDCKKAGLSPSEHDKANVKVGGKVPNDRIFDEINTIDKMSQKRAMVAAVLLAGFSQEFTQDLEDRDYDDPNVIDADYVEDTPAPVKKVETVKVGPEYAKNQGMIEVPGEDEDIAPLYEEANESHEEEKKSDPNRIVGPEDLAKIKESRERNGIEKIFIDSYVAKKFKKPVKQLTVAELDILLQRMEYKISDEVYGKVSDVIAKFYTKVPKQSAISSEIVACKEKYGVSFDRLEDAELKEFLSGIKLRADAV